MNRPGSWERELTAAFSVMLGRPVEAFDAAAEYALYYGNHVLNAAWLFETVGVAGDLGRVWQAGGDGSRPKVLEICLGLDWGLDLGRSRFELDFAEESAVSRAFGARPESNLVAEACRTVPGRELAATLTAHGLGPADVAAGIEAGDFGVRTAFRVVTDGTLRDALLAAIRGRRGPDGLRPGPDEAAVLPLVASLFTAREEEPAPAVAAERDRLLAPIGDPRLRAHLWSPYLDMPWDRGPDGTAGAAAADPTVEGRPVAAWHLAYFGEVALSITQTAAAAAR
jgi:hypothetical protein